MTQATVSELAVGMEIPEFQRATGLHNWNRYAAVNYEFVDIHMDDEAGQLPHRLRHGQPAVVIPACHAAPVDG